MPPKIMTIRSFKRWVPKLFNCDSGALLVKMRASFETKNV